MSLAVVVPTLNEEEALRGCLPTVLGTADEVVVSDGGSRDGTVAVARQFGLEPVCGPPGRGGQLDRGAAATRSRILLFLHADTRLPEGARCQVERAVAAGFVGGGFRVRFDADRLILRAGACLINARTLLTRTPLGDQAQFATRRAFESLGGFRDWPILEDLDFMLRLRREGRIAVLRPAATTSARRFLQRGILRTVATNWLIWGLFFGGVSPHRLARLYREVR